jgi:diguanylate cyclase (GGDEF)-like protein/PAS domain S-box-containing protein
VGSVVEVIDAAALNANILAELKFGARRPISREAAGPPEEPFVKPNDPPSEYLDEAERTVPRAERLASVIRQGAAMRDTVFLNNIIDSVADPILVKDERLRFLLVNQALCDFAGLPRERFIGRTDADLFPLEQAHAFNVKDRLVFETGLPNINEEEHTHADGSVRSIRTTKTMFVNDDGAKVLVGIFTDLTALRAAQRELEAVNRRLHELAHHDSLTGLPNRMSFEAALERAVAAAQRHGENFTVLFMDLNGFKQVNDTHGHAAGDELIRATAARLANVVRDSDFMARLGGDEFVVIARTAGNVEALHLAQRLARAVAEPFNLAAGQVGISVSIGLANYPRDGSDGAALIRNADIAMYRAKRVTGQAFEFYDEAQSGVARRQFLLESQLRRDVEQGQIDIHLQPIVKLDDGRVLGFEALARWNHAQFGAVSPAEFIPLAEASRLIAPLGLIVLRRACEFIARHAKPGQYVSVNVSSRQLEDATFTATLRRILAETGAAPEQLAIELTESTFGSTDIAAVLQELRDIGIALFIDDFGVGYSNLMRLQQTPSDVIKIDRGFVNEIGSGVGKDHASTAMIRTIVILAAELGLKVIAEGIEEEHQARTLRELGVGMGQGYFYGRPAPAPAPATE